MKQRNIPRREGVDARSMITSFRWLRWKITGSPLKKEELEGLKTSLYPETETNTRYNPHDQPSVNLLSLLEKYKCEKPEFENRVPKEFR